MDNLIIDIDGTILNGNKEINNSSSFLKQLDREGYNFILATNSIKSHNIQIKRLESIGIKMNPNKIYSPVDSINQMILQNSITNVMVVGSNDEIEQIKANHTLSNPELIILLDFEKSNFAYNDLQIIINNIENGSSVISASGSPYYLKDDKKHIDTGAYVKFIESITNSEIEIFGKPSAQYFKNAGLILSNNNITVVGDDWSTDIIGAKKVGYSTALIKSGKYKTGDENNCNPDYVINSLKEMIFIKNLTYE